MMPATVNDLVPNGPGSVNAGDAAKCPAADGTVLPYAKAFVVQFSTETDGRLEHATGRVEHLATGRRTRFASVAELLACIVALLADAGSEAAARMGPHRPD